MLDLVISMPDNVAEGLKKAPGILARHLSKGANRAAQETARKAKREAPKAESTLTNSIQVSPASRFSKLVGPQVGYAEHVVKDIQGQGAMPPVQSILDWIQVKGITPNNPDMEQKDLAFVIARSIKQRGTPAHTFIDDTREAMQDRVSQIMRGAAMNGLAEAGLL
ncbi:hypothetical protein HMF8227_02361 [Saliniradius amylolyticus]|uniref:Uncharacterized protein n=1 Tax=Saliniradius amylolyticus TaxID=2183582 RepID=A0A2S2E5A2_9ALTE|nr:hypothetical protein [Saliniradius amylolyticus]AWL12813.1 hypothetical protein HMF8227_02361 [Saliniradius amylolyticus]